MISCSYHKEGNFSVKAPTDWVRTDSITKKGRKIVSMHEKVFDTVPRFANNISVTFFHYSGVDSYVNSLIFDSKKSFAYFEETARGITRVNNHTAKWIQNVLELKGKSYIVEQRAYFIEDHGNIYMITCTAKVKQLDKIENEISAVLNSFEIIE